MQWQIPKLITNKEEIAYNVLAKKIKNYCWVSVVLWMTLNNDSMTYADIEKPDPNCEYCWGHMDESELMLYFEGKEAERNRQI